MGASLFALIPLAFAIFAWVLGVYALILVIKALKIYIAKNSPPYQ